MEKEMEHKGEQRYGPGYKRCSSCGWRKGTSPDEAMFNSEEIKPVAIAVIELRLSEHIS